MDRLCPAGCLSYPGGQLPFGLGRPTLLVNDQCGYYYERPEVLAELQDGRFDALIRLAREGMEQGLAVFNVQLMEPSLISRERSLLPAAVEAIHGATGCCIAVDSRDPVTVDLALSKYPYKALCNSVNGEWQNLEAMLPVIAKHGAAVGTALVYENGLPQTVQERLLVARRIVNAANAHGIPREDVIIDAICLPTAVAPDSMRTTLETIKALHDELGVPTLIGASNAGFMMPKPRMIDLAYFVAGVSWGLDVAMIDPQTPLLPWMTRAMDFLMGVDLAGKGYLQQVRNARGSSTAGSVK